MTKQKKHLRTYWKGRMKGYKFMAGSRRIMGGKAKILLKTTPEGFLVTPEGKDYLTPMIFTERESGLVITPVTDFTEGWETASARYRRDAAQQWLGLPDNVSSADRMREATEKYYFVVRVADPHQELKIENTVGIFGLVRGSGEIVNFFLYDDSLSLTDKRDIIKKIPTTKPLTIKVKSTDTERKNFWESMGLREDMVVGDFIVMKKPTTREKVKRKPIRVEEVV
jgi:hypothetical protein